MNCASVSVSGYLGMAVEWMSGAVVYVCLAVVFALFVWIVLRVLSMANELACMRQQLCSLISLSHNMQRRLEALTLSARRCEEQIEHFIYDSDLGRGIDESWSEPFCAPDGYAYALDLLAEGFCAADVATHCGLAKAEVELIQSLSLGMRRKT